MPLRGINHIVLKVRNLEESDRFYCGVLGLEKAGERGRMWFYRAGAHHHDLALIEVGRHATSPHWQQTGLFHFCLDVSDENALAELYERCRNAGANIQGTVDHTIMRSFYVADPDGNTVELGVDVPESEWAALPDPFAADKPYALRKTR
jgi:catechol 2,3-dioxygenase